MSKDDLDRTLERDPDGGPDQIADRTLNRDHGKETKREAGSGAGREAPSAKKLVSGAGKKPVARPRKPPPAAVANEPVDPNQTVEQRAEQRVEVVIPMELQVQVEVPGAGRISGATENMSCSGMLARLNGPIRPDSRCQVHFLSGKDVLPSQVFGWVTRIVKSRFGYSVAFRFERPVELKVGPEPPKHRS